MSVNFSRSFVVLGESGKERNASPLSTVCFCAILNSRPFKRYHWKVLSQIDGSRFRLRSWKSDRRIWCFRWADQLFWPLTGFGLRWWLSKRKPSARSGTYYFPPDLYSVNLKQILVLKFHRILVSSMSVMTDPCQGSCDHTFCQKCIEKALQANSCCPLCKQSLKRRQLTPLPCLGDICRHLPEAFAEINVKVNEICNCFITFRHTPTLCMSNWTLIFLSSWEAAIGLKSFAYAYSKGGQVFRERSWYPGRSVFLFTFILNCLNFILIFRSAVRKSMNLVERMNAPEAERKRKRKPSESS